MHDTISTDIKRKGENSEKRNIYLYQQVQNHAHAGRQL
jgi:hypothetical protein